MAAEHSLAQREHITHLFEDLSLCPALRSSVSGCLLQDTEGLRSRNCPPGVGSRDLGLTDGKQWLYVFIVVPWARLDY